MARDITCMSVNRTNCELVTYQAAREQDYMYIVAVWYKVVDAITAYPRQDKEDQKQLSENEIALPRGSHQ